MFLAVTAALFSIPIAIALGVVAALYRESVFDKMISILTLAAVSTPAAASAEGTVLKGGVRRPVTGESAPAKPVSVPTTGTARWAAHSVPTVALGGFVVAALKIHGASPIIQDC